MNLNKTKTVVIGFPTTLFISGIIGYFVYGTLRGALAIMLIYFVLSIIGILGIIPGLGLVSYWFLGKFAITKLLAFTKITSTWAIDLAFWINSLLAVVMSVIAVFYLFYKAKEKQISKKPSKLEEAMNYCKKKFTNKTDIDSCVKKRIEA